MQTYEVLHIKSPPVLGLLSRLHRLSGRIQAIVGRRVPIYIALKVALDAADKLSDSDLYYELEVVN